MVIGDEGGKVVSKRQISPGGGVDSPFQLRRLQTRLFRRLRKGVRYRHTIHTAQGTEAHFDFGGFIEKRLCLVTGILCGQQLPKQSATIEIRR